MCLRTVVRNFLPEATREGFCVYALIYLQTAQKKGLTLRHKVSPQ